MVRGVIIFAVCLALAGMARAQQIAEVPKRDPKAPTPEAQARLMLDAGRAALADKNPAEAVRHFANALWYDPYAPAFLANLLEASAADPDAFDLWLSQWIAVISDEKGAAAVEEKWRKRVQGVDAWPLKVNTARAEAVAELATFVKEQGSKGGEAASHPHARRFAAQLGIELCRASPALIRRHGPTFTAVFTPAVLPDHRPVLAALKELMDQLVGEQKPGDAIRVAQCLLGFAAQSGFKQFDGPKPPDLAAVAMAARAGLQRARAQLDAARKDAILTIEQLEAMTPEEREAFTRDHASFANPGVTFSPNKLYRVETTCGHDTLVGVAKTIELHHARLVGYFGKDPFVGQQGLVRIVPESWGLEAEGTPHWWAGGFQSGPVTTLKFSCGNIAGLGHGLTHELTHRFDGALHAGIPAWLAEGRAVWTGAAYGPPADPRFVPNYAPFGSIEDAFVKGYAAEDRLKKLVEGTIEDYRHNYPAGCALYVYLSQWKDGDKLVYAERFARFENECRTGNGNSLENFTAHFCDGRQGRPKDFKEFAKRFGEFITGFYWQNRAKSPWTGLFTEKVPDSGHWPFIYDGPTWHRGRTRAEPWFGQDQARLAGDLLYAHDRKKDAAAAWAWSLLVDDWSPEVAAKLAKVYNEQNQSHNAWVVLAETSRRFPGQMAVPGMPSELKRSFTKVFLFHDALRDAGKLAADGGRPASACVLASDESRLSEWLGLSQHVVSASADVAAKLLHRLDEPPVPLGLFGWEEDRLTDYEERRVKDLWYELPDGDLQVGRTKPREGTGETDRYSAWQHAFTRSKQWIGAGAYAIRMKVQATTSFISGAAILGWTRRDRNVRVGFSCGDFLYSIGAKDAANKFDSVHCNLWGLRERDGALWGSNPGRTVKLKTPSNTFDLDIYVDGAQAYAFLNGTLVGTYHTLDGAPIEGYVGFASGQGAYLVKAPTVERFDRTLAAGIDRGFPACLDLSRDGTTPGRELVNREVRGVPTNRLGTVVVWMPQLPSAVQPDTLAAPDEMATETSVVAQAAREAMVAAKADQPIVVVVPATLPKDVLQKVEADVKNAVPGVTSVLVHARKEPLTRKQDNPELPLRTTPSLLFVDPSGVLRCVEPFEAVQQRLPGGLEHWVTVFGAIARELPTGTNAK